MNFFSWAFFISFTDHISNKISHIATSQRNVFDATIDNETISNWDDMSDSISWVKNGSCIADSLIDSWRGDKSENSLNSNVQSFDVESLEHNLC